jgi:hypothetical protein
VASRSNRFPESAADEPELAKLCPLNIIAPKSHAFLNTNYANEPKNGECRAISLFSLARKMPPSV